MGLLEKEFNLCTPWGTENKKLKDLDKNDIYWLKDLDKIELLLELKEEYLTLVLDNEAMKEEHYRVLTLKCKDCDSEARLKLASLDLKKLTF